MDTAASVMEGGTVEGHTQETSLHSPSSTEFHLLPRAAKCGISGSSFFSKLFSILSCKYSRQGCASSPHCSLKCQGAPGVLGAAQNGLIDANFPGEPDLKRV